MRLFHLCARVCIAWLPSGEQLRTCPSLPLPFAVRCCGGGSSGSLRGCQLPSYTVRGMSGRCTSSHVRSIFGSSWCAITSIRFGGALCRADAVLCAAGSAGAALDASAPMLSS